MDLHELRVAARLIDGLAKRALFAEKQMVALEGQCAEWRRIADELKAARNLTTATAESVIKERDDWKKVAQSHAGSMALLPATTPKRAWLALKKERDGFFVQIQDMRAELDRLLAQLREEKQHGDKLWSELHELRKLRARAHPVKVGEWVLRTGGGGAYPIGTVAQVNQYSPSGDYLVRLAGQTRIVTWFKENCTPCDPPEATHDTPAGKQAAESAVKREPKPGDKVRLVREPSHTDIPAMLPWSKAFGMPGDTAIVVIMAVPDKVPSGTIPVRTGMGRCFFWPISCIEIVEDAK